MCRRKCWVSFPSVWFLRLAFHETAHLFYSEAMLGWFLLLPDATKMTVRDKKKKSYFCDVENECSK